MAQAGPCHDRIGGELEERLTRHGTERVAKSGHLVFQPDEVRNDRHTGESRYPVLTKLAHLDPGLRRGDESILLRAGSIATVARPQSSGKPPADGYSTGQGKGPREPETALVRVEAKKNRGNPGFSSERPV